MKLYHLLVALFMLPLSAQGQTAEACKARNVEIGFNLGHALDNAWQPGLQRGGYIRSSLSVLKRFGNMQYGVTAEGGTNSDDYWYLSPGLVANRVFGCSRGYFYAGAMAGYVVSDDMLGESGQGRKLTQGYVFGLQTGAVHAISKRLSLTAEIAVRSTQVWKPGTPSFYAGIYEEPVKRVEDVIVYVPVTVGIRYRL